MQKELENPEEAIDRMVKIHNGQYEGLFEEAEELLGRVPEISDYHDLYVWCLNRITYIVCQNIYLAEKGFIKTSYNKEMLRYKEKRNNLDKTFVKYTGRTINQKMLDKLDAMEKMSKKQKNKPPEIIEQLIDALQLHPNPTNGKYLRIGKSDRQFVFWIVENNFHDRLTPDNYFDFIQCCLRKEVINRYFRDAGYSKIKPESKNKKDKTGIDSA